MALAKAALITAIKNLANALATYDGSSGKSQSDAIDKYATDLADAIDVYVKTGTVSVITACPAGAGTGTGTVS